jgi:hypothetical protein
MGHLTPADYRRMARLRGTTTEIFGAAGSADRAASALATAQRFHYLVFRDPSGAEAGL